ncbi:MAG TPA: hypoxanthine phosphoribosyltransferase [Gaiellales bacterium]|jgi:hypoxanthine phosphoribosyltransferase|nr:hypoxanthine phosphoribosyltransferase [Gaiellales bacterium]
MSTLAERAAASAPGEVYLPAELVSARVAELAAAIDRDHRGRPLVLVAVLKGAAVFAADLSRALTVPHRLDTMALSAYSGTDRGGGRIRLLKDLDQPVRGEQVVVVEDVIDTGLTMHNLLRSLRARSPESVRLCTLLDRPHRRLVELDVAYVGFTAAERFCVGYGLGHHQRFRNLPDIHFLA